MAFGQTLTTTIRGTVIDKESQQALIGAQIMLLDIEPTIGAVTNVKGEFKLENVPIGRRNIRVTYVGYETVTIPNVDLNSGKETILNIQMEELVVSGKAVVITGEKKEKTVANEMATVSARQLSIEDSKRYAGSLNDVSRMAQNFAGVQGANDTRNDLVVRGNSSLGVLYRLDGMDIPNPNHFAIQGSSGGPISILNNNVLENSDFFTGAFPAEYGNAYAGVFDLKMRNGNNAKREYLGQIGFNGIEAMAEGPISKKKGSSYLVNYRYSTLEAFKTMGISFGTLAVPEYMDLSFKLNFPHKKGRTYLYGIGGNSRISFLNDEKDDDDLFVPGARNLYYGTTMGAMGLVSTRLLKNKAYLKGSIGVTYSRNNIVNDTLDENGENPFNTFKNQSGNGRYTFNLKYHKKVNSKNAFSIGGYAHYLFFDLKEQFYSRRLNDYVSRLDYDGGSQLLQTYAQWQHKPSNRWVLNLGLHSPYYNVNQQALLEPRLGAKWKATKRVSLNAAYGRHSQLPPINIFFNQVRDDDGSMISPNQGLNFITSSHYVVGIDWQVTDFTSFKSEVYYQHLTNVPVDDSSSSYSVLNQGANFYYSFPPYLNNNGKGYNYGIEFTIERALNKGFYYLATMSLFQSKYKASNGKIYNTAFNGNYNMNLLGGYEWQLFKKREEQKGKWTGTLNLRFSLNGGQRYTPFDLEKSKALGVGVLDQSQVFENKFADYWRIDWRGGLKRNGAKITHEMAVEIQNITNRQNEFVIQYDPDAQQVETLYQLGLLPVVQYRIYF